MKAIIFDMDGTVVDTTQIEYKAWQRMFDEQGVNFSYEEYIQVLGAKGSEIVQERLDWDEDAIEDLLQKKEDYFKELVQNNGLKLIPQVDNLLQQIKDIPLKIALATGASKDKLKFIMEHFNIEHFFDAIITADDVENGKPDPEVFLKAAQKLGVPPEECIVMEDATNGVEAAKAGHMACIAITSTRGKDQLEKADLVINNYQELNIRQFIAQHIHQ